MTVYWLGYPSIHSSISKQTPNNTFQTPIDAGTKPFKYDWEEDFDPDHMESLTGPSKSDPKSPKSDRDSGSRQAHSAALMFLLDLSALPHHHVDVEAAAADAQVSLCVCVRDTHYSQHRTIPYNRHTNNDPYSITHIHTYIYTHTHTFDPHAHIHTYTHRPRTLSA